MDSRQWREALRVDLRRQNLPPAYIDRLVEELSDHSIDLQTENPSMDAQVALDRIGSTDKIAAVASCEFRRRTFASRHPWLTFILGPLAIVPLLFVAFVLGVCIVGSVFGIAMEWLIQDTALWPSQRTQSLVESWCLSGFDGYIRFIPFAMAAWLYCRWGRLSERRYWSWAACSLVAVIAGLFITKSIPSSGDGPGMWIIGFAFRANVRQFLQFIVPLAVAAGLLLRIPQRLGPGNNTQNQAAILPSAAFPPAQ